MAQLSDDCFAFGGDLMSMQAALDLLGTRIVAVPEAEAVGLTRARGRVLAEPLIAERDVPPYDNSAVDGYAVAFDTLSAGGETALPVVGRATAGHPLENAASPTSAVRIFT